MLLSDHIQPPGFILYSSGKFSKFVSNTYYMMSRLPLVFIKLNFGTEKRYYHLTSDLPHHRKPFFHPLQIRLFLQSVPAHSLRTTAITP